MNDCVHHRKRKHFEAAALLPFRVDPKTDEQDDWDDVEPIPPQMDRQKAENPVEKSKQHRKARIVGDELEISLEYRNALRARRIASFLGRDNWRGMWIDSHRDCFDKTIKPGEPVLLAIEIDRLFQLMRWMQECAAATRGNELRDAIVAH